MGFVYLLTHDAMPDLVKIGKTDTSVEERMRSLNNTAVPFGFKCFYAAEVEDSADVERRLHQAFGDSHVGKEFFEIHPIRVKHVLEMVAIDDATPREEIVADKEEEEQMLRNEKRQFKRRFSLFRLGLKPGDVLVFTHDDRITATVASDNEVTYEGKVQSLSSAALTAIHKCGYKWQTIAGPNYWLFDGRPIKEIADETTSSDD
jgi:hypothetical protein